MKDQEKARILNSGRRALCRALPQLLPLYLEALIEAVYYKHSSFEFNLKA